MKRVRKFGLKFGKVLFSFHCCFEVVMKQVFLLALALMLVISLVSAQSSTSSERCSKCCKEMRNSMLPILTLKCSFY